MLNLIYGQMVLGLSVGVFYAMLSLGLAIIFGLLNIINFAHGAFYMLGAIIALVGYTQLGHWLGDSSFHVGFFETLIIAPLLVGLLGAVIERLLIRHIYGQHHVYGLLLTFGITLVIQGVMTQYFNVSGALYDGTPALFAGVVNLGFMYVPRYRLFVIVAGTGLCILTWFFIEKSRLGIILRAAIHNPQLVESFGINVPLLITLTFAFGVALAALAGVLAAPIYSVGPIMGQNIIIIVFAVVIIGGLGSLIGTIVTGLSLGLLQGAVEAIYPAGSNVVIFLFMIAVLTLRPSGLFGDK